MKKDSDKDKIETLTAKLELAMDVVEFYGAEHNWLKQNLREPDSKDVGHGGYRARLAQDMIREIE